MPSTEPFRIASVPRHLWITLEPLADGVATLCMEPGCEPKHLGAPGRTRDPKPAAQAPYRLGAPLTPEDESPRTTSCRLRTDLVASHHVHTDHEGRRGRVPSGTAVARSTADVSTGGCALLAAGSPKQIAAPSPTIDVTVSARIHVPQSSPNKTDEP